MIGLSNEIKNILLNDSNITNIVKQQIYNIINDERTTTPFLVVELKSLLPEYTKEYYINDEAEFNIVCVASKYDVVIELASKLRDKLETKKYVLDSHTLDSIRFNGFEEDFTNNLYTGVISFTCKIFNNE